jgi:hypothetical protein
MELALHATEATALAQILWFLLGIGVGAAGVQMLRHFSRR